MPSSKAIASILMSDREQLMQAQDKEVGYVRDGTLDQEFTLPRGKPQVGSAIYDAAFLAGSAVGRLRVCW